jgi:hypothetical protein
MKSHKVLNFFALIIISTSTALSQDDDAQTAAQGQLEAYNRQNIEEFLSWYADEVEVYNFPDEMIYRGKVKMRERYSNAWKQNPNQKAVVTNRIINGNTVIDKEHVSGRANGIENDVIAIYKIEKGKIGKVYFIRD